MIWLTLTTHFLVKLLVIRKKLVLENVSQSISHKGFHIIAGMSIKKNVSLNNFSKVYHNQFPNKIYHVLQCQFAPLKEIDTIRIVPTPSTVLGPRLQQSVPQHGY